MFVCKVDNPFPFGSEFAWDSTGQEEEYVWGRFFGKIAPHAPPHLASTPLSFVSSPGTSPTDESTTSSSSRAADRAQAAAATGSSSKAIWHMVQSENG